MVFMVCLTDNTGPQMVDSVIECEYVLLNALGKTE
jgi:hypothetical protein